MGEPVRSGAKKWQVAFLLAVALGFACWGGSLWFGARHERWSDGLDAHLRELESSRADLYEPEVFRGVLAEWREGHPEPWVPPRWSAVALWVVLAGGAAAVVRPGSKKA